MTSAHIQGTFPSPSSPSHQRLQHRRRFLQSRSLAELDSNSLLQSHKRYVYVLSRIYMLLSDNNDGYCALSYLCKSNLCCSDVEPCNTATQDSNHEICQFKIKIIELSVFYSMKIYKWPTIIGESPRHVKPSVPVRTSQAANSYPIHTRTLSQS